MNPRILDRPVPRCHDHLRVLRNDHESRWSRCMRNGGGGRRQLREMPGILTGETKPDYERPVLISTRAAQWEMIFPALLGC